MKNIDIRTAIVYTGLVLVGLFLLMLVTPGITAGPGFMVMGGIFAVLPLVILAALATFIFGKSKRAAKPISPLVSKLLGISAAASIAISVASTYVSTRISPWDPIHNKFVYENIGVGLLFAAYAATLILMTRQKFVYWPFWSASDKKHADERERAVRNRVFEKSYRTNILLMLLGIWLAQIPAQRMHHELYQTAILCLLGLPSIIASWQKDA